MSLRTGKKDLCERCWMHRPLCLCALAPSLELDTRIEVLMHARERRVTSNSARLACLALPNSAIHFRGDRDAPPAAGGLVAPGRATYLLYPTDNAEVLTPELARALPRPLTLIVPDGTWRQARKVASRESALANVPRIKLAAGAPSQYRLRTSPHAQNLSTFEAIARALGLIEGAEIEAQLMQLFAVKVDWTLWGRGQRAPADCVRPIPDAAFLAARLAGMLGGEKSREMQRARRFTK